MQLDAVGVGDADGNLDAVAHASLERILAQFENFCVVTESVRHGIEVSVCITDADGVQLHGTARTEPAAS